MAANQTNSDTNGDNEQVSKQPVFVSQSRSAATKVKTKKGPKTREATSNVLKRLTEIAKSGISKPDVYRAAFRCLAEHFGANYGLFFARFGATEVQDDYTNDDRCPEDILSVADAMVTEAEAESRANVRLFAQPDERTIAVLSAPLYNGSAQVGTMCLATRIRANKDARVLLSELLSLIAFIGSLNHASTATSSTGFNATDKAFQRVLKYGSVTEFAFSLVNTVATKLSCQQVAFGMMENQQAKVLSISGLDHFSRSSHGVVAIQQAMEECADAGEAIHYCVANSSVANTENQSFLLHRQWHRAANNSSLLSIPMQLNGKAPLAVISLQRSVDRPFTDLEIETITNLVGPFAPAVHLLERSSRGYFAQFKESFAQTKQYFLAPDRIGRKIAGLALALAFLFFVFGWIPHRITVPCQVQPFAVNHVSAPYQASLREVLVKDGAKVIAGQIIARLDARPLQLERERLLSEIATHRIDMDRGLAARNVSEAALAATSLEAAEMQLQLTDDRISKADIVAPVDGVVIRGGLDQRVGQLLEFGEPLVEIGQVESISVRLDIPEELAHFVEVGDEGRFASFARPGKRLNFQIERITPVAVVENDKNVFFANAELESAPDWILFGMEGTAKVKAGWRPTWWLATHGLVNRIRMALWF